MSFKEFLLHAEPNRVYPCESCGVVLGRSAVVYVIIALAGVGICVVTSLAILAALQQDLSWATVVGVGVGTAGVMAIGFTLAVKIIGYCLPLWRVAK